MPTTSRKVGLAAVILVLAGCGGAAFEEETDTTTSSIVGDSTTVVDSVTTSTTTVAETTTTTGTTTTAPPEARPLSGVVGATANGVGWLADAGLYEVEVDGRLLVLQMPEAFTYIPTDDGGLWLAPADIPDNGYQINLMAITPYAGIIPASQVGIHQPHDPIVPVVAEPMPADLSGWLDSIEQITNERGDTHEGLDYSAQSWEIEVDPTAGETFSCAYGNCLGVLAHESSGVWVMGDDFSFWLWQFAGSGSGLYGFGQAPLDSAAQATAFQRSVLDGLTISD